MLSLRYLQQAALVVLNAFQSMQQVIFEDDSSSSEDEQDNDILRLLPVIARDNEVVRIEDYVERIIPNYTNQQFQSHFRLDLEAYEAMEREIGPLMLLNEEGLRDGLGRQNMPIRKQLLSVLWLLATPDSYRSVGDRFGMSKSSLSRSFRRAVLALNEIAPRIITWPSREQRQVIAQKFEQVAGLPNVVGAIDGTFVQIKAPVNDPEVFVTRKCIYAYTAQGICDSELKFTDVFIGYPGSVGDARIFRNSHIYQDILANKNRFFDQGQFIIGDKAYPNFTWCILPYIDRGNLTQAQRNFNTQHARERSSIERCWALLFGRFRRLKYLDMNWHNFIPATVLACCVLHNICLNHGLNLEGFDDEEERDLLLPADDIVEEEEVGNEQGIEYRNRLCTMMNVHLEEDSSSPPDDDSWMNVDADDRTLRDMLDLIVPDGDVEFDINIIGAPIRKLMHLQLQSSKTVPPDLKS